MTLSEELEWRGFVNQTTYKDNHQLDNESINFYWGVDPSAPSMTIGNLAAAMMVRCFIEHGHHATLLIGGATGLIGDPDGKSEERTLKSLEEIGGNKEKIAEEYRRVFDGKPFEIVDNYDWFKDMGFLSFLRDVGKHVPMRQMLARDFVQSRLGEDGNGISYAEFSYSLIQGYDFLHLYQAKGVRLQLCGADQWGNSIAGVELIRRIAGGEAHIWSTPLIVNKATGKKFGKSEEGAIWLDEQLTSVYRFYQFWLNVDDEGVIDYLKVYTRLSREEIEHVAAEFNQNRASRIAQKRLAYEVTALVHGRDRAESVVRISEALFGRRAYQDLTEDDFAQLAHELPVIEGAAAPIIDILVVGGLASSKTEARSFVAGGAVSLQGTKITPDKQEITQEDALHGYVVVRRGKNQQMLYKFI